MARMTIKAPAMEGIEEVVVLEWHAAVGQHLDTDGALVTLEADKVDVVVPTYAPGTVIEILAAEGAEIAVGAPLCVIDTDL